MTAIIQLTIPDGWQTFHLPWASLALAILTFGPGRIALDHALHLDQVSRP
jgi:putative oxidoreductase